MCLLLVTPPVNQSTYTEPGVAVVVKAAVPTHLSYLDSALKALLEVRATEQAEITRLSGQVAPLKEQ